MEQVSLEFYYGQEPGTLEYFQVPKLLIKDERFRKISDSAKILYALMLDRMSLSIRNGWEDEDGRIYIQYSLSSIMNDTGCAREKAGKLLKELEAGGLIVKKKTPGHSTAIYVKTIGQNRKEAEAVETENTALNACSTENNEETKDKWFENRTSTKTEVVRESNQSGHQTGSKIEPVRKPNQYENRTSTETEVVRKSNQYENRTSQENEVVRKSNQSGHQTGSKIEPVMISNQYENRTSTEIEVVRKSNQYENRTSQESEPVRKSNQYGNRTSTEIEPVKKSKDTMIDKIDKIDNKNINLYITDPSINQSQSVNAEAYMELIRKNIDYDIGMQHQEQEFRDMFEELYFTICDIVCTEGVSIRVAGREMPYALVKSRFLKLRLDHMKYVIHCMRNNTTKISNIKSYMITALYNSVTSIETYYTAEYNHERIQPGNPY